MIYYIIDRRFPSAFRWSAELTTRIGHAKLMTFELPYLYHFVYPGQSIKTIVSDTARFMRQAKWGDGSVDMIRLCGHGNSGYVEIGEGLTETTAGAFSELARFMKRDFKLSGIEIHGCGVGSDTSILSPKSTINNPKCMYGSTQQENAPGLRLLTKLAKVINRNVKAGIHCQLADKNWQFEGTTITVRPDGISWLLNGDGANVKW